jgi:hypothetical protein
MPAPSGLAAQLGHEAPRWRAGAHFRDDGNIEKKRRPPALSEDGESQTRTGDTIFRHLERCWS